MKREAYLVLLPVTYQKPFGVNHILSLTTTYQTIPPSLRTSCPLPFQFLVK